MYKHPISCQPVHLSAVLPVESLQILKALVACITLARFSKLARTDFHCVWGEINSVHCDSSHLNNDMQK